VFRYLQLPSEENDRLQKIRNLIKRLERELEEENDSKKMIALRTEIGELKRQLGEIE